VNYVRTQRVTDPSAANVRVMTMHAAKGLEFDAVVLPELDVSLRGQPPAFVAGRDLKTLRVNFVCRYVNEAVQALLTDEERRAFEQVRQQNVEESLSLLYVAMTRAIHGLYMYIPGKRNSKSDKKDGWQKLLRATLAPDSVEENEEERLLLYQHGNPMWFGEAQSKQALRPGLEGLERVSFREPGKERRRGLEHVAPSRREGGGHVALKHLFKPSEGTGKAAGTLYHAWFESIEWLDDGMPTEASLRATADKLRSSLPAEILTNLDPYLGRMREWLAQSELTAVLRRAAYANSDQPGFPAALESIWKKTIVPRKVERERRFSVVDDGKIWDGSLDRIVWLGDGERIVAADVIDFKTDAIEPENEKAIRERTEHYRPQVEAYRRVVAKMARLPEECISARLVFTNAGRVMPI
jgi:ATP-dependent exoDNAse (exonuclease V) beta subunit